MRIEPGRKVALIVEGNWYAILQRHRFLKDQPIETEQSTNALSGELQDVENPNGIWLKPDEKWSEFSRGSLFVPWQFILTVVLLGPDEDKRPGF